MKLSIYYLLIILPLAGLFLVTKVSATWFSLGMITYAFLYRPLIDGERLISNGKIAKNERWKMFIPFFRFSHFKSLYFKRGK